MPPRSPDARLPQVGPYLISRLKELEQKHDIIGDVRGKGLMLGVELVKDRESKVRASRDYPLLSLSSMRALEGGRVGIGWLARCWAGWIWVNGWAGAVQHYQGGKGGLLDIQSRVQQPHSGRHGCRHDIDALPAHRIQTRVQQLRSGCHGYHPDTRSVRPHRRSRRPRRRCRSWSA